MRTIIWLKVTKVVDEYWLLLQSLPSLGEWIEITTAAAGYMQCKSLPSLGEWIEIKELIVTLIKQMCLSLRWESGLKSIGLAMAVFGLGVSPFAGRVD